jgi:hypothetical protein
MDLDEQLCSDIQMQGTDIDQLTHQRGLCQEVMAPILLININRVSGDYTTALRDCTNKDEVMIYYQDKYGWTKEVVQSIDWRAHGKALSQLSQRQQKTITQFKISVQDACAHIAELARKAKIIFYNALIHRQPYTGQKWPPGQEAN